MSPGPLEAHLGFWLRFVSNHVSQRFHPLLEGEGVTVTDWVALRTLWTNPQTTHAQLIEALGMTSRGSALGPRLAALADANDAHFFGHLDSAVRQSLQQAMQELVGPGDVLRIQAADPAGRLRGLHRLDRQPPRDLPGPARRDSRGALLSRPRGVVPRQSAHRARKPPSTG